MWSLGGQDGDACGLRGRETVWTSRQVNSSITLSSRELWYVCVYMYTYTHTKTYTYPYIHTYTQDDIAAQAHDLALSRRYTQLSFEPWHTQWTPQQGPLAHQDEPLRDGMRRMHHTSAPLPLPDCHTGVIKIINIHTSARAHTHTNTNTNTNTHRGRKLRRAHELGRHQCQALGRVRGRVRGRFPQGRVSRRLGSLCCRS